MCDRFLHELLRNERAPGFRWPRSCCQFCCYQCSPKNRAELALRWGREPEAALVSLRLERRAMALNAKQKLFGTYSAHEFVQEYGLTHLVAAAETRNADVDRYYTVVDVRRVCRPASFKDPATGKSSRGRNGRTIKDPTKKGRAWRSIRPYAVTDTVVEAIAILDRLAREHGIRVAVDGDMPRLEVRLMPRKVTEWPVTTHAYVVVPGQVKVKERKGFEQEWVAAQARESGPRRRRSRADDVAQRHVNSPDRTSLGGSGRSL